MYFYLRIILRMAFLFCQCIFFRQISIHSRIEVGLGLQMLPKIVDVMSAMTELKEVGRMGA